MNTVLFYFKAAQNIWRKVVLEVYFWLPDPNLRITNSAANFDSNEDDLGFLLHLSCSETNNHPTMRTRPLKTTVLTTTFPQRGVVGLHTQPNSSYSVMSGAPTDHCCAAVAASHSGNFWATRTHNSNCQQMKTRGEKSLEMFPGDRNISKWLKLQCWGNSCAGGFFFSHKTMI